MAARFTVGRAGTMTKRETALSPMRAAGYENDRHAWTRLYVENRVGFDSATRAWLEGRRRAKEDGKP
jgi:hypothetical protein